MTLSTEYFLMAFLLAVAVIQYAVTRGGFKGLMFSQSLRLNLAIVMILAVPALVFLFTWNDHNPVGIIEGAQQAGLFSLASLAAVITVVLLSSLTNLKMKLAGPEEKPLGLESLKNMTFIQAIMKRYHWKQ